MKLPPKIALIVILLLLFGQAACKRKQMPAANANSTTPTNSTGEHDRTQARALLEEVKELYRNDNDEKAVELFQEAVKLDPELAEGYFRLGLAYTAVGKDDEAEEVYKKAT